MSIESIIYEIRKYDCKLVEITGGEPLVQKESLDLMKILCDEDYEVMLETGGHMPVQDVDKRVKIIMDLKCPSSKMSDKNLYENIKYLKPGDEIKFVIGTEEDYEWSKEKVEKYRINERNNVLFSPVFGEMEPENLASLILKDNLKVRMQMQMHKFIWEPNKRGV